MSFIKNLTNSPSSNGSLVIRHQYQERRQFSADKNYIMKLLLYLLIFCFSSLTIYAQTQWQPAPYQRVPEIADCSIGDIAVARLLPQPHIRYCPANAVATNNMFPGSQPAPRGPIS
jgi:hypothetical protein